MKILFTLLIALFMFSANIFAQEPIDTDGNGYRNISTLEQLRWISENDSSWSWNFELDNDIDASDTKNWNVGDHDNDPNTPDSAMGWEPMGTWKKEFSGTINGNGHSIKNLYSNRPKNSNIAFIGTNKNMKLINLNIIECDFTGDNVVSSIVTYNSENSIIQYCSATGSVTGKEGIAGFVSQNFAYIQNCYSNVNINGDADVAGFVTLNYGEISYCYSTGKVQTISNPYGFSATNGGDIKSCFWDVETSKTAQSDGGEGKTTAEMQIKTTYENAGWNFDFIWDIDSYYPYLIFYNSIISNSPKDDDGDGYVNIKNIEDLRWLSDTDLYLNKNFELDNDIDANETKNWKNGWRPIGSKKDPFTGNINGNGFSINNLFIDRPESDHVGFLGYSESKRIENIIFNNIDVTGRNFTGGLVGNISSNNKYNERSDISNCIVKGNISGNNKVGFIAGYSAIDSVITCNSSGEIHGNSYVGGLFGEADVLSVIDCYSKGKITSTGDYIGGLIGKLVYYSQIQTSYSLMDISGNDYLGGLVGESSSYSFFECYYSGLIIGKNYIGGLTGNQVLQAILNNCYTLGNINASGNNVGGLCGYSYSNIIKSYSEMNIIGNDNIGGISGTNNAVIDSCYYIGTINAENIAGGIVGNNRNSIRNSYTEGSINGTNDKIGGICGLMEKDKRYCDLYIQNSYSKMNVSGNGKVGGIVGYNKAGNVLMSYSLGQIQGIKNVGGLVGENTSYISRSYSHSNVSGDNNIGGLVGYNHDYDVNYSKIFDCYSTGVVTGNENIGGLIGSTDNNKVSGYWDIETSGLDVSAVGIGKTTSEMKDINTYQYWNFNLIWDIENDYPFVNYRYDNKPQDTDGDGYLNIKSLDDLRWLSECEEGLDENWELDNDIDASETQYWNDGEGFNPIAKNLNGDNCTQSSFSGIFEGNGNTISNLFIRRTDQLEVGLFSYLTGAVLNLNLENCTIEGKDYVGGIAGLSYRMDGWHYKPYYILSLNKIVNCSLSGTIAGNDYVGGIAGKAENASINLCAANVIIEGNDYVGGIVGNYSYYYDNFSIFLNRIKFSGSKGIIIGNNYVGGLIGYTEKPVVSCYSQANVKGSSYIGGLLGYSSSFVTGCYSSGIVEADSVSGGLIGYNNKDINYIQGCFWDTETSKMNYSEGGIPKTTEELFDKELFLSEGWNFDFIWDIEDSYPFINLNEEMRPEDTDGNGYLNIKTLTDLRWLSETDLDLGQNWELDNNINASETKNWNSGFGFEPIGDTTNILTGNFNGNGNTIDSLYINCPYEIYFAFISVAKDTILNLGLENINYIVNEHNDYAAGLVSKMISGKIENSYITGEISETENNNIYKSISGFVAELGNSYHNIQDFKTIFDTVHINNCYTNWRISSQNNGLFAGFVGFNMAGIINKCYSLGKIDAQNGSVAGFVTYNIGKTNNSFSRTELTGDAVGGFVSDIGYYDTININYCYYAGKILKIDNNTGGFVYNPHHPEDMPHNLKTSFWDSELSGVGTSHGGIPKNTAEMKTKSTFTDVGWDFENIWYISPEVNDGYPFFIGMDSIPISVAESLISDSDIFIYPNPASDYIEITLDGAHLGCGNHQIEIYDVLGEPVPNMSTSVPSGHLRQRRTIRMNVANLPKGVYFVKIGYRIEKFVKM